jgi:hypothetical protein
MHSWMGEIHKLDDKMSSAEYFRFLASQGVHDQKCIFRLNFLRNLKLTNDF